MGERFIPATGFDCLLKWYDPLVRWCTQEQVFKAHLLDQSAIASQAKVLDVGCGSGTLALAIAQRHPTACVAGLDSDSRILAQAQQKKGASRVDWQIGSATRMHFPDQAFDCVFCTLVFHHLLRREKQQALQEVLRVLKPGGTFYLADFARPASPWAQLRFLPARLIDGWQRTRCNAQGRLATLVCEAGFREVQQTLVVASLLGTIRCFRARKSDVQAATTGQASNAIPLPTTAPNYDLESEVS